MSVDLSEFIGEASPCKVARLIAALNEVDTERHDRLVSAFVNKGVDGEYRVTAARITKTMKDWGYTVGLETVRKHRVQECSCGN